MDRIVKTFGIVPVKGSSRSRASAGALGMINAMQNGCIALLAVDGPRGPLLIPKPGVLTIARKTNATVYTLAVSAGHSIKLNSWDKYFIPLPFTKITFKIQKFPVPDESPEKESLDRMYRQLVADARSINSPCVEGIDDEPPGGEAEE